MKSIYFVIAFILISFFASAQNTEDVYEEAKLKMVCKAIQFNCEQQGQKKIADKIQCQSYQEIDNALPNNFKSSRRLLNTFKDKKYANYAGLEARLDKLTTDVAEELRKIGNSVKKTKAEKSEWQNKVDNLVMDFTRVKDEALSKAEQTVVPENNNQDNNNQVVENNNTTQNQPLQQNNNNTTTTESNTGLWITTIFAALVALMSIGYAYMVKSTVVHRIRRAEEMFKERYKLIDERTDSMVTKDEMEVFGSNLAKQMGQSQQIKEHTEKSSSAKESLLQQAYNKVIGEKPLFYAKINPENATFSIDELTSSPSKEHFYEIEIDEENPEMASYKVVEMPDYHKLAINYAQDLLLPACLLLNEPTEANCIITVERGFIQRVGEEWQILEKAKIRLELV